MAALRAFHAHTTAALAEISDADLASAHRVLGAVIEAMAAFHTELRPAVMSWFGPRV